MTGRVLVVVDGPTCKTRGRDPITVCRLARRGGDVALWLRRCGPEISEAVVQCIGPAGITVGRDPDLARRLDVGVHLQARAQRRPEVGWVGMSCHDRDELQHAQRLGVDYVTLSPIWKSPGKSGAQRPLGLKKFEALAAEIDLPVLALGGVTVERTQRCLRAGATGVAVLGSVCGAPDIEAAVRGFTEACP